MAHDGTLLKLSFAQQTAKTGGAKPKSASQTTLGSMKKNLISAKAAFQKQLDDDGWAGDVADGVSALWGSKNRASVIRKELAGEQDRLNQLAQAAQKGDANFKTKFKQIYGVEYNKQAVEAYNKKPNAANFKKAYGSKYPDIRARVNEYNKSQQEGAEVVKTSAKVTTGVAIGVATGGAGLVALGVAAGATTLASAGVEYSDRYKWTGGGGLRKGTSHKKIWKGAAWDGLSVAAGGAVGKIATTAVKGTTMAAKVGRGAINVAGDTGVGAAQEYSETGKVTATGVVTNATMGGVGSAVTSGVLKEAKAKIVRNFSSKTKNTPSAAQTSTTTTSQTKTNLNENEVSPMTSEEKGKKPSQNNDISHDKASNDDTALAAFLAKKKAELRTGQKAHNITTDKVDTTPKNTENYVVNEDGSVTKVSNVPTDSNKSAISKEMQKLKSKTKATSTATERPEVIGKGHIFDKNTGKVIKVNPEKIKIETNEYGISLNDEFGNVLGSVQTDKELIVNGKTYLHFEGLQSNVDGLGIGTKLIRELEKKSFELGHEGRLIATASPFPSTGTKKPLTNLGFYYKLGFKATDSEIDKQITQCIREGKEIPLSLNSFVQIEYIPKKSAQNSTGHAYNENAAPLAGGGVFTSSSGGGMFSKIKSKLGFNTKIEPEMKDKLKANYMDDIIQTVEANDNMHVSQRLKETLNGKPLVTELDSPASLKDISSHVGNGDVCSVGSGNNQKLYVNDNGTPIELKISKEKLEELFPPLETATFNQPGGTKVCTILSKINTMLDTPSGRTKIYTMLEQDGNDIIVNLRGGRAPVRFTGGKPVNINLKDNGYSLISGNAQGVEMLEQAVLVDRIRQIEDNLDTVNIIDFSVQKIIKRAGKEAADNTASIPLLGKAGALKMTPQGISKTIQNDYEPGTDMLTALWEGHARSVVGYDATTKIVTYHDPLKGGVDIQEPLETFLSHNGLTINLNKATPTTVNRTQHNSTTAQAEVHSATPKKDKIEQTKTEQPNVQNDTSTSFVSKTTDLVQGKTFVIARTTDGIPIGATVTQSNVIIKKSGKYVSIDIPKRGSYEAIQENSSGNFLIVKTDMNGKVSVVTSETPELPNVSVPPRTDNSVLKDSKVPSKDVNTSRVSISSQAKTKAPLEIPTGAQLVDTVVIAGKSRRRIKMPDGSIRTEYNGRWQNF